MKWIVVALCVSLVVPAAGCRGKRLTQAPDPVAATVNGVPIPLKPIEAAVERDLAKKAKFGLNQKSPEVEARQRQQRIDEAIRDELLAQASQSMEYPGLEKEVEAQLKAMSEAAPDGDRKAPEITDELRQRVRRKLRVERYLKVAGLAAPDIAEEEIKKVYEANKASFARPPSLHVRHVLVKIASEGEREAARAKATQILEEIRAKKITFEDAAKKYSDCESAKAGGDLGGVTKGYMPEPFERAVLALKPGEIAGPVETKFGFHLVQFVGNNPPYTPDYAAAREFILRYLQDEASQKLVAKHIEQLREKAQIAVLVK